MARLMLAILLAVCVSYASAERWSSWAPKRPCYCNGDKYDTYPVYDSYEQYGYEMWERTCYEEGPDDCPRKYEEQQRPCDCGPVLTPGEIAGIVVGSVVFLILIIIIIIWCCYCGCDCGDCDGGRPMRRWGSDSSIGYKVRGPTVIQAPPPVAVSGQHIHVPSPVPAFQPAPVTYAIAPPKPITFAQSVVQQAPIHQHGAIYAQKQGPTISILQ